MRLISREEALRIREYQAVEVEFNNQGLRSRQPFTPDSQFYLSIGPYDFFRAPVITSSMAGTVAVWDP